MNVTARIKAIIEANRNPRVCSHEEFEAWLMGPKSTLFKRRAAEVLQTMRIMRLVAVDQGGNPGWEVSRQMPRMDEYMKLARAEYARGSEETPLRTAA